MQSILDTSDFLSVSMKAHKFFAKTSSYWIDFYIYSCKHCKKMKKNLQKNHVVKRKSLFEEKNCNINF